MDLWIFLAIVFGVVAVASSWARRRRNTGPLPATPPTPKQLAHIARLRKERHADDLAGVAPSTAEGASWLIARLKDRPPRKKSPP